MRLDHDCVRDLLLYLEEHLELYENVIISEITLKHYDRDTLTYTAIKLKEAGYISANRIRDSFGCRDYGFLP